MAASLHLHTREAGRSLPHGHGPGHLEVLHVERIRPALRRLDRAAFAQGNGPARLHLQGVPGSSRSTVRRAELVFLAEGEMPAPQLDRERQLLRLYYPAVELDQVLDLLTQRAQHLCYFWQPRAGGRALAMLVASH